MTNPTFQGIELVAEIINRNTQLVGSLQFDENNIIVRQRTCNYLRKDAISQPLACEELERLIGRFVTTI